MTEQQQQLALDLGETVQADAARVELAYVHALTAAGAQQQLQPADSGLAGLALELARAVDTAARREDVRGVATVARELREINAQLRMDPRSRGEAGGDDLDQLISDLTAPQRPGQVGHPAQP